MSDDSSVDSHRKKACWRYAWPIGIVALIPAAVVFGLAIFLTPPWVAGCIGLLAFIGLALKFIRLQVTEFEHIASDGRVVAPVVYSAKDTAQGVLVIEEAAWLSLLEDHLVIRSAQQALQIPYSEIDAMHSERKALRRIWTLSNSRYAVLEICCRDPRIMARLATSAGSKAAGAP